MDLNDNNGILLHAARMGSVDDLRMLIAQVADIEARSDLNATPLIVSAIFGHLKAVTFLLDRGADIEARNEFKATALMLASAYGHTPVARVLLDRGADPSAEDNKNKSSLLLAVSNGCLEVVSVMMNRLDRLGRSSEIEKVDSLGRTPLILAVLGGHADVARLLLRRGVDVNRADNTGLRAIDHAAFEHNQRMLSLLFEHGESPYQVLYDGWTLDEACQEKPECLAVIRSWRNALAIDSVIREASSYHTKPTFQQ